MGNNLKKGHYNVDIGDHTYDLDTTTIPTSTTFGDFTESFTSTTTSSSSHWSIADPGDWVDYADYGGSESPGVTPVNNLSATTLNSSFVDDAPTLDADNDIAPTVLKSIVLILIIVAAIFSNLLVVLSVVWYHKLRHINNYFLVSLAVADLLVACFAMTFNATVEITGKWNFGYRICDLWNSLDVHFSTVSTLHLCCISVDRYYAIVKPLKYHSHITVKVAACMIGVAWTAPTLISFLPIFLGWYTTAEHQRWREHHPDECIFRVNQPYAFISSTLTFWAPVVTMLILYHRIYKEAVRQKEAIRRSSVTPSQHNLIVDSEGIRSRFQELQANGFRSKKSSSGAKKKTSNGRLRSGRSSASSEAASTTPNRLTVPSSSSRHYLDPSDAELMVPLRSANTEPPDKTDSAKTNNGESELSETTFTVPPAPAAAAQPPLPTPKALPSKGTAPTLTPPTIKITSSGNGGRKVSIAASTGSEGLRERHRIHTSWRKEHKAFVTLGIVMGAFLLCWLPFFTWYLTVTICGDTYCPCPDIVVSILFWIGYFNSTLNPVIYVMTNHDFKEAFTGILRRIFCCSVKDSKKDWGFHSSSHMEYV